MFSRPIHRCLRSILQSLRGTYHIPIYFKSSCANCSGSGAFNCDSCSPNKFLTLQGNCDEYCRYSYHKSGDNKCLKCDPNCLDCFKEPTKCLECNPKMHLYLKNYTCVDFCPIRFFSYLNICFDCDDSCRTCKGFGPNKCTSCQV